MGSNLVWKKGHFQFIYPQFAKPKPVDEKLEAMSVERIRCYRNHCESTIERMGRGWSTKVKAFLGITLLRWKEPKGFVEVIDHYKDRKVRWWIQPVCVLLVVGLSLLQWYLAKLNPNKHPLPLHQALSLMFLVGYFLAYIVPWINRRCPSEGRITSRAIIRFRGNHSQFFAQCGDFVPIIDGQKNTGSKK